MNFLDIPTKEIAQFLPAIRNFTRKRKVWVLEAKKVILHGLNWSGGSKTEYSAISLVNGQSARTELSRQPPWANQFEGAEIEVPENVVIVEHGYFCGKPSTVRLHVHPNNMPKMLEMKV